MVVEIMATRRSLRHWGGLDTAASVAPEYEKERLRRIEENASKLESLGLKEGATMLKVRLEKRPKKSIKKVAEVTNEDGEYTPNEDELIII